ncbi:TonB-dependent receptor [Parahaliea maris]|uniref:TonB-dependent receptor n=1 Tax=Parahaliea maris TaxID=2716870 RepID=A0A5C8ZRV3_9GAMM|nr:TonB-dependent receptor [Parahaliea maris]TXS90237.1 TonB-dependent receptor [Parahaliea maris]
MHIHNESAAFPPARNTLLTLAVSAAVLQFSPFAAAEPDTGLLEEVVVTAERRTGDVQDIPIAMTAMTADQLRKKSILRMEDLQYAAPSLSINDAAITQSVNIRGIGLASGDPNATNGVGLYIDGLFQPPIVNTLSFYDLSDVQVLRGPQGTFSGANSTGGAVMLNSRRPEIGADLNGYIQVGAGNYSSTEAQGAVGGSLGDTLAVRAAFNWRDRDSFYDDIGPANSDAGSLDEFRGRLGVLWRPIDSLDLYLKYESSDKDTGGYPTRPMDTSSFAFARTADVRDLSFNADPKHEESDDTLLLDVTYTFDNDIAVNFLAGRQEKEIDVVYDYDSTAALPLRQTQVIAEDQDSFEVTVVSPTDSDLQWVTGYYYQNNEIDVNLQTPGPLILIGIEKETTGLFGQVGYNFTDDLQVEFGLRKVWFEAGGLPGSGGYFGPISAGPAFPINGDYEDDDLVGKLSVNWTRGDHLIYGSVARGWKPGGYNNPNPSDNFAPEEVLSYELGWKATLLDGAVRTAFAVFYSDYENFQFDTIDITSGGSGIKNVADADLMGAEFSIDAQLGGFLFDAAIAYVDTELGASTFVDERQSGNPNLPQCSNGAQPPQCFDYTPFIVDSAGGSMLNAPELTYTLGVEYTFDVFNGATLTPRLNYGYVDEQWVNLAYQDVDLLDSRGLLSALLTLQTDKWRVQAYGRNLTDKEYVSGQYLSIASGGVEFYGAPREYGVNFSYDF